MNRQQLTLIEPTATWRLDKRTRERGRRGVADARAILADTRRKEVVGEQPDHVAAA